MSPPIATPVAADGADVSGAAKNGILRSPGSWIFAVRGGMQLLGGGHVDEKCTATGGFTCSSSASADTDEASPLMLGVDGLIHVAPGLRLGLGYQVLPYAATSLDDEQQDAIHLGHEHALQAAVEGIVPLGRNVALALRAQGGLRMLIVGGDLADDGDEFLRSCSETVGARCEVDHGPMLGGSYGVMLGIVGGGAVRWRIDLALDRFSIGLPGQRLSFTTDLPDDSIYRGGTLYGTRSWVLGGVEL